MLEADGFPQVVLVYLRNVHKPMPWGGALRSARFETIGGRAFIVGETILQKPHPYADRRTAFAWEEVSMVMEFESEEAYLSYKKRRRRFLSRVFRR